jgi:DNA ligase (NAD+)
MIDIEDITVSELVDLLQEASDRYYNEGESDLSDAEYDALENLLREMDPDNLFLLGVGASERGEKVPLPVPMGSLDQLQENEVEDWIRKNHLDIEEFIITEKLDGTSALLVYGNDGNLQIAFSRGNGTEGADITRHVRRMKNVPQKVNRPMIVRVEAVLPKKDWPEVKAKMAQTTGREYKNARNWGAGQMNKKEASQVFYDFQHMVAFEIVRPSHWAKHEQLQILHDEGFIVAKSWVNLATDLNDKTLQNYIQVLRTVGEYEIDGVVIDVNLAVVRSVMSPHELNPGYAKKYKVGGSDNVATVRVKNVIWKPSKHGYLKPRVEIEPVDLMGVTISFCTGFNAKFIEEGGIGPGAVIQITRSGDVIPFIQKVITPSIAEMPAGFGNMVWSDNHVDLIMTEMTDAVRFEQLNHFFSKLNVDHAGTGNIQKVFNAGYEDPISCVRMTEGQWKEAVGESDGSKIFKSLHAKLTGVRLACLAAASGCFERGIGERKLQPVVNTYGNLSASISDLTTVEGVSEITARKIVSGNARFVEFVESIDSFITFAEPTKKASGQFDGVYAVLTGVRDAELQSAIEDGGGEVGSSMSKCTILIAKDPNSNSSKATKARERNAEIISLSTARERFMNV